MVRKATRAAHHIQHFPALHPGSSSWNVAGTEDARHSYPAVHMGYRPAAGRMGFLNLGMDSGFVRHLGCRSRSLAGHLGCYTVERSARALHSPTSRPVRSLAEASTTVTVCEVTRLRRGCARTLMVSKCQQSAGSEVDAE
jgi:hypothetical protein